MHVNESITESKETISQIITNITEPVKRTTFAIDANTEKDKNKPNDHRIILFWIYLFILIILCVIWCNLKGKLIFLSNNQW